MAKRILYHALFWLVYLFWSGYVEGSYDGNFYRAFLSDLVQLPLKIAVTYLILYFLLPKFIQKGKYGWPGFLFLLLVLISAFLYRVTVYKIIQPFYYPESTFYFWNIPRWLLGLFEIYSIAAIAVSIKLFKNKYKSLEREQELKQEKLKTELSFLKAQMNPHFLFNTLNSIYALTRSQSPQAPDAVMKLSQILRYMLYETEKKTTSVEEELKMVENYIQLQKLRFGNKINVRIKKEIHDPTALMAPLIILPLVENAFKHGVNSYSDSTEIGVNIRLEGPHLTINITNPIVELSLNDNKAEGIGLANINRQLQLLYREYSLKYKAEGNNFMVDLQINLNSYAGIELLDR